MSIKFTFTKHNICFPSKLVAGNGGQHIYNIVIDSDKDNGELCSRGDYVSFDQYKAAPAPAGFKGIVREQAANGNWYVEVVDPADAVLIYEVPEIAENYDSRFTALDNFYNAVPVDENGEVIGTKTVRGYGLIKGDMFELSEMAFDKTPAENKAVTFSAGKYVVA